MAMGVFYYDLGPLISKFVASNFSKVLTMMKSYKEKNYEQALIETYLKFDELLRNSSINQFLKEHHRTKSEISIDVKMESDFNTNVLNDVECYSTCPKTRKSSDDSIVKQILTFNNSTIEVSFKYFEQDEAKHQDLVASHMGTTANILLIRGNYLYLANVGDSLAVLYKDKQAIRLNQEHKTSLQSEYARINNSGARIINNRVEGRLNLTRALGDLSFKENKNLKYFDQAVTAYPEITKMKITKDMDFIVMGCDGVWDCVDVQKFCEHISMKLRSGVKKCDMLPGLFDQIIAKNNNSIIF
jgi:serine/threonine protein phosphatase PrpC